MSDDEENLIDQREAAALIGVHPSRVSQLAAVLCPIRAGRRRLYRRDAVERFVAARDAQRDARGRA